MVSVIKNSAGLIIAYAEWNIVDDKGLLDKDGEYCHVHEFWIHDLYRGCGVFNELIRLIDTHKFSHSFKWVYWERRKHDDRQSPSYKRERLSKIGEINGFFKATKL